MTGTQTPNTGATPGSPDAAGTAPASAGHGIAGPDAQPQVSPSRSLITGKDGGCGASDAPAAAPVALLIQLGGPDPFPEETAGDCPATAHDFWCTRNDGHELPHVALAGPLGVVAVWPPYLDLNL